MHKRERWQSDRPGRGSAGGFTLTEVLVAMGLFVIGFAAVAAIFPAGMVLQQQTQDRIQSLDAARSARSTVRATANAIYQPFLDNLYDDAEFNATGGTQLVPVPTVASESREMVWPLSTRAIMATQGSGGTDGRYYWIPLIRDRDPRAASSSTVRNRDWQFYVAILKRENDTFYITNRSSRNRDSQRRSRFVGQQVYGNVVDGQSDPRIPSIAGAEIDGTVSETDEIAGNRADTYIFAESNLTSEFSAGDKVIDDRGRSYRVVRVNEGSNSITVNGPTADANTLWFAPRASDGLGASPLQRIVTVQSENLFQR